MKSKGGHLRLKLKRENFLKQFVHQIWDIFRFFFFCICFVLSKIEIKLVINIYINDIKTSSQKKHNKKTLTFKCKSSSQKQVCKITIEMNQKTNLLFVQKQKRACKCFAS